MIPPLGRLESQAFDAVSTYFYTTKNLFFFPMLKHPTLPWQDLMTLIPGTMSFMALPTLLSLKARISCGETFLQYFQWKTK